MDRDLNKPNENGFQESSGRNQPLGSHGKPQDGPNAAIDCKAYAKAMGLTEEKVWQKVLSGQLQGRTSNGRLFIMNSGYQASAETTTAAQPVERRGASAGGRESAMPTIATVPPAAMLPNADFELRGGEPVINPAYPHLPPIPIEGDARHYLEFFERKVSLKASPAVEKSGDSLETAIVIDYLRHLQREQEQLIGMTKDAIEQITQRANQVVEVKDELLAVKKAEVERLQKDVLELAANLRSARQEIEDLNMLNDALTASPGQQ